MPRGLFCQYCGERGDLCSCSTKMGGQDRTSSVRADGIFCEPYFVIGYILAILAPFLGMFMGVLPMMFGSDTGSARGARLLYSSIGIFIMYFLLVTCVALVA